MGSIHIGKGNQSIHIRTCYYRPLGPKWISNNDIYSCHITGKEKIRIIIYYMQAFLHASNYLDNLLEIKALILHSRGSKYKIIMYLFSMVFEDKQNFSEKRKRIFEYMDKYIQYFLMRSLIFCTYNFSPNLPKI